MKKIFEILIFTIISIFTSGNLVFADEISERLKSIKCVTDYSKNPDIEVIDTIKIGMFPQNDITGVNKEPIEWIALKRNNDKVLLVSKYVLDAVDCISANAKGGMFENYKWDKSFYRKWLNEDFYNAAFSDDEKKRIMTTALDNKRWCDNTYDKIFPLTYGEWREFRDTKEQMGLSSDNFIFRSKLTNYSKKRRDDAFYIAESYRPARDRVELSWMYDNESEYLHREMDSYTFNGKYLMGNSQYVTGFNRGGYAGLRPAMWVCVNEIENIDLQNTINNDLNIEVEEHKYELRNDGIYMDGVLQTKTNNGWIFWNGYYRYLNERGETAHGCWVDGRYLSDYGQMYRAQVLPDGVRYVDDNGYLVDINVDFAQSIAKRPLTPNSWYKTDAGFYYFIEADGVSTKKGWYKIICSAI